jgi:hypothetical protein
MCSQNITPENGYEGEGKGGVDLDKLEVNCVQRLFVRVCMAKVKYMRCFRADKGSGVKGGVKKKSFSVCVVSRSFDRA